MSYSCSRGFRPDAAAAAAAGRNARRLSALQRPNSWIQSVDKGWFDLRPATIQRAVSLSLTRHNTIRSEAKPLGTTHWPLVFSMVQPACTHRQQIKTLWGGWDIWIHLYTLLYVLSFLLIYFSYCLHCNVIFNYFFWTNLPLNFIQESLPRYACPAVRQSLRLHSAPGGVWMLSGSPCCSSAQLAEGVWQNLGFGHCGGDQ